MQSNMEFWNALSRPPTSALKPISGGRLKGKTDITPQWRYQAMTEMFGPIGFGWKYTIDRLWTEDGPNGERMAFAQVSVYVAHESTWSDAIQGIGGAAMIAMEKSGLVGSDEAYKMATTDALSVALKMLGVAAEIYLGNFDGSKYKTEAPAAEEPVHDKVIVAKFFGARTMDELGAVWASLDAEQRRRHADVKDARKAELNQKADRDAFVGEMEAQA